MKYLSSVLLAALLGLHTPNSVAVECSTSSCYIDVYNSVDTNSSDVLKRVENIHKRLTTVIGSQQAKRSKLFVIDSNGYPWAVALSDNSIVITTGAISDMYGDSDLETGDARVAFVLGHELSHLTTEDLFHHRSFMFNNKQGATRPTWDKARPDDELRADLKGYTFASIAGYRTDLLLEGETPFFRSWLTQITNNISSDTHPDNETRRQYVKLGFNKILQDVPYYEFSIALAHFGHYLSAQALLENHLNIAETEQAYANLGYIHIQRARSYMPRELAYKYWLPTLLEPESGVAPQGQRSLFNSGLSKQAIHHLEKAEWSLKQAIEMDGENLASYLNLAAVYLYMPDRIHRAYAAIEDAKRTPLGEIASIKNQLESIYQLIRVLDDADGEDRWPKARDKLTEMALTLSPAPDNMLFNLGRMLDERGSEDTAKKFWMMLHERVGQLPLAYQEEVCVRLQLQCTAQEIKSPWTMIDIPFGEDIRYPETKRYLSEKWNTSVVNGKSLPGIDAEVFTNNSGDSLLAIDNQLEMAIVRSVPHEYRNVSDLLEKFGEPQVYLPISEGQLLSYGMWAAVIKDLEVKELWIDKLN